MFYAKTLLAAGVLLSLTAFNAQAALTTNSNGLTVYDSGNNTIWTQDANLLGTMESNPTAYGYADSSSLIAAINDANGGMNGFGGVIHDTPNYFDNGTYILTAADFGSGGTVDWWAGQAYVHYLNSINYGGSTQWALPTNNTGPYITDHQLGELFYNELGGTFNTSISTNHNAGYNLFSNVKSSYLGGTESASFPQFARGFDMYNGNIDGATKDIQFYAWAVSPGQVSAAPLPGTALLFGTSMLGLLGIKRHGHAG